VEKNESKNRTPQGVLLQEADTGFHAWNDLAFGVTQKVKGFAVSIIRISEFCPVSFRDVLVFIKSAIPPTIVFPNFLDLLHKLKLAAISSSREDVNDGKRNGVLAAGTIEDLRPLWVWLVAVHGTGGMTRLITTPQRGMIGDSCQTDHTWIGWRKDGKRNDVLAARTSKDRFLATFLGTGGMTRLTTAPQLGIIGDRCQTDHTWFGLSHQAKGSKSGLVKS